MKTYFGQYCRVERKAGGVGCTERQLIRAARTFLTPSALTRALRAERHEWLRDLLSYRQEARKLARRVGA